MKIIIATTFMPFRHEAHPGLAEPLADVLGEQGHEVDIVRLPFDADSESQLEQIFAFRCFDLTTGSGNIFDRLIAIGWAAGALRHPAKSIWLTTSSDQAAFTMSGESHRPAELGVREAKRLAAASDGIASALRTLGMDEVSLLYPPLTDAAAFIPKPAQDHLVIKLPQDSPDRTALILETLQETRMRGMFVVRPEERRTLCDMIEGAGMTDLAQPLNVTDRAAVGEAVSTAFAVLHLEPSTPYSGDVPLGALRARKPLLLAEDTLLRSVFPASAILTVKLASHAFAETLKGLRDDRQRCEQLGAAGARFEKNVTWEQVAKRLLA